MVSAPDNSCGCPFNPARVSAATKSLACSARAGWAKCIERGPPAWRARSPSRSWRRGVPPIAMRWSASNGPSGGVVPAVRIDRSHVFSNHLRIRFRTFRRRDARPGHLPPCRQPADGVPRDRQLAEQAAL